MGEALDIDCDRHGKSIVAVVCTHLLHEKVRPVGFVENSSDPNDLQAWCDECEVLFEKEGDLTDAFCEFNDMRLVCSGCYAVIKELHSQGA